MALGHGGRQVVVPDLPGIAAHPRPRLLVAPQEGLQRLAERELHREEPRVAEHEHEGVHWPAEPEDVPELAPVDLGDLGGPERERHERRVHRAGADPPDGAAQRADPAAVALGAEHGQDVHGGALGVLRKQRLDAGTERREDRGPRPGRRRRERHAPAPRHLPNALSVDAQVAGDPAIAPALGVGEPQDLGLDGGRQHGGPPFAGPGVPWHGARCLSRLVSSARGVLSAPNPRSANVFRADRVSRGASRYGDLTPRVCCPNRPDRVSRTARTPYGALTPCRAWPCAIIASRHSGRRQARISWAYTGDGRGTAVGARAASRVGRT